MAGPSLGTCRHNEGVSHPAPAATASGLLALAELVADGGVLVLTGAGISTDSGIPDYRGPTGALRRHTPMTYQAFVGDAAARQRYWARSYLGWRQIADAQPNACHHAVAGLQRSGLLSGIITQNVDGLHQRAGATDVIELHGGLDHTLCLACGDSRPRVELDAALRALNPGFDARAEQINPDGDVWLPDAALSDFVVALCPACGSDLLKPDVVFFGENVPLDRVTRSFALVAQATSILVLGSSLTVFSGYRFVRAAARASIPVAIVNQGPSRADPLATVRIGAALSQVLPRLLGSSR
jgi:NAD-dependent SIR2 family protein deacetylase